MGRLHRPPPVLPSPPPLQLGDGRPGLPGRLDPPDCRRPAGVVAAGANSPAVTSHANPGQEDEPASLQVETEQRVEVRILVC